LVGKIAGLVMVGVPPANALDYFAQLKAMEHEEHINRQAGEFSIMTAKINAEAQSKLSSIIENRMI
jgi:hypothetical protein